MLIHAARERSSAARNATVSERYCLCSHGQMVADKLLSLQRTDRGIKNSLHWKLDVTFREDDAHVRLRHTAIAPNELRKMALQLLKVDKSVKGGVASKHLRCAWYFTYALDVLTQTVPLSGHILSNAFFQQPFLILSLLILPVLFRMED